MHACDRRTDGQTDRRTDRITTPKTTFAYARRVKPISVGRISRGSQSRVSMMRDLWRKEFTKDASFEFGVKEWIGDDEESGKRRMGWGKHKEVKLVYEVKMEVYSRDEARHIGKSDLWSPGNREEVADGQASLTTSEERVLLTVWREMRLCRFVGWLVVRTL